MDVVETREGDSEEVRRLEDDRNSLIKQQNLLKEMLLKTQEESNETRERLAAALESVEKIKGKQKEALKLKREVEFLRRDLTVSQDENTLLTNQHKSLKEMLEETQKKLAHSLEEVGATSGFSEQISEKNQEVEVLQKELEKNRESQQVLEQQLEDLRGKWAESKGELAEAIGKLSIANQEIDSLMEKCRHLQGESDTKHKLEDLEATREKLSQFAEAVEDLQKERIEQEKHYEELKEELAKAYTTSKDLQQQFTTLQEENATLKEQQGQLKDFLNEAQEEFIQIKEELTRTRQRLENSEKTIIELEIQNDDLRGQKRKVEEAKSGEVTVAYDQVEVLREHLATVQEENNVYQLRNERLENGLEETAKQLTELKQVQVDTLNKLNTSHETLAELESKNQELTDQLKDIEELEEAQEKLKQTHEELSRELDEERAAKLELIDELETVREQFLKLKEDYHNGQETIEKLIPLSSENERLQERLNETTARIEELEKEQVSMKQTLVQGLKEAKEIKAQYQHAASERTTMIQKNLRIQEQMQQIKEALQRKEIELQQTLVKQKEIESTQHLTGQKLQEKEQESEQRSKQIENLQTELTTVREEFEGRSSEIKMAQQHMAKKVKEAAELNDQVTTLKEKVGSLEGELQIAKGQATDARGQMEAYSQIERELQTEIKNREVKIHQLETLLKESDARNEELQDLEENYNQMQQLLKNLGSFIGSGPEAFTPPSRPKKKPVPKKTQDDLDLFTANPVHKQQKDQLF